MNLYKYYSKPQELTGYDNRLSKVPQLAFEYASSTRKRFPEGEAAMASDPDTAIYYARYILNRRWDGPYADQAEDVIARDPNWAYRYASKFDLVYDEKNKRFTK